MNAPAYREALGLATGDVVTYQDQGPFEIQAIHGPYTSQRTSASFVIWAFPVVDLTLVPLNSNQTGRVKAVHPTPDGFRDASGSLLTIRKQAGRRTFQPSLFASDEPEQYRLNAAVDYTLNAWHCPACQTDFNSPSSFCPGCGQLALKIYLVDEQSEQSPTRVVRFQEVSQFWVPAQQTWTNPNFVYIGRQMPAYNLPESAWANPFRVGASLSRQEAIEKYREYLTSRPELLAQLSELAGKTLVCWCKSPAAPHTPCHGDILVDLLSQRT